MSLTKFIEENIVIPFYTARLHSLEKITLSKVLETKNPYLFKVKNLKLAQDLIQEMLDAFLSSSEETIFGNKLEKLAIYVNNQAFGGYKPTEGEYPSVDLIFCKNNFTYILCIKSGSVWGNADSTKKMLENLHKIKNEKFKSSKKVVLGCGICYGRSVADTSGELHKYRGQAFWELITGQNNFYTDIITPLGEAIKDRDLEFKKNYETKVNQLTSELLVDFCTNNQIDWVKIVEFNSGNKAK